MLFLISQWFTRGINIFFFIVNSSKRPEMLVKICIISIFDFKNLNNNVVIPVFIKIYFFIQVRLQAIYTIENHLISANRLNDENTIQVHLYDVFTKQLFFPSIPS